MAQLAVPLMVGGTLMSYDDQKKQGRELAEQGAVQRALNEVAAGQAKAIGQMGAREETRKAEIMASRAVAVAAAGGASEDINHLIADIKGEGAYRASLAMYEAETEAESLRYQGLMAEQTGRKQKKAMGRRAFGTVLSGAGSVLSYSTKSSRFGGKPKSTPKGYGTKPIATPLNEN